MTLNRDKNILIIGLGLLGGSYAMALSRKDYRVRAISKTQQSIDYALQKGMIESGTTEVTKEFVEWADIVIFGLYPHIFKDWIADYQQFFKPGTIITDVTGIKGDFVRTIQGMLREDVEYIPAHPMCGKEVSGVENADDKIFTGANYLVTPTEKNTQEAIEICRDLGWILGCYRVAELDIDKHDEIIGFVSQLTHCIAITLMTCNEKEHLEKYTGDSFRDLTRIARINDVMWSELFIDNKAALLEQMKEFREQFEKLETMIETEDVDAMRAMMRRSTQRRKLFDK
ncbi:MAG: prephenate dehydrogenase [Clostridia bacterium]|nr:prephenate dehydrogenase [Clostridia bacterium]